MLFIEYLSSDPRFFMAVIVTVVLSITLHELAHGYVAVWLGDRTPIEQERLTLNPIVHMGPMSIILLLTAGIAWGMMPINPSRLRGRYGPALVAAAGPATNFLLGILAVIAVGLWRRYDHRTADEMGDRLDNLMYLLWVFGFTNFHLAIFNLVPVPPLDGAAILANVSKSYAHLLASLRAAGGVAVVFLLVFFFAGNFTAPAAQYLAVHALRLVRGS